MMGASHCAKRFATIAEPASAVRQHVSGILFGARTHFAPKQVQIQSVACRSPLHMGDGIAIADLPMRRRLAYRRLRSLRPRPELTPGADENPEYGFQ